MVAWLPLVLTGMLAIGAEREAPPKKEAPVRGGVAGQRDGRQRGQQNIAEFVDKVIEEVDASDAQAEQLEAIAKEHDEAMAAARKAQDNLSEEDQAKIRELHQQVREARRDGDDEQVEKLQAEIHELMGADPRAIMQETHEKIAAVLTAEQLPAFHKLVQEQQQDRRGGFGHGRAGERGPGGGRGFAIGRFVEQVIEATDATPEQQEQLKTIASEHAESVAAARKEATAAREANADKIQELREEMREAMQDGDNESVEAIRQQMRELTGAPQEKLMDQTLEKIAGVLTDEQKPAYDDLVKELKDRLAQRPAFDGRGPRDRGEGRGPRQRGFERRGPRPAPAEDDGADDE